MSTDGTNPTQARRSAADEPEPVLAPADDTQADAVPTDDTRTVPVPTDDTRVLKEPADDPSTSPYGTPPTVGQVEDVTTPDPVARAAQVDGDAAEAPAPVRPARRPVRVGTVVWGLFIAAVGVGLLAWASGLTFDLQLALTLLLALTGTALLVGSVASASRKPRR